MHHTCMHEYMHGINTHPQFMVLAETSTLGIFCGRNVRGRNVRAEMSYIPLMGTQTFFIRFRPNFIYGLLSNSHPSLNMGFVCGTIIKMAIKISATCQFALVDTQT